MAREATEVACGGHACSLTTVQWGSTPLRHGYHYFVLLLPYGCPSSRRRLPKAAFSLQMRG
jgi:hypothetical protein